MTRKDKDTIFQLALLLLFLVACMLIIFWTMASAADESLAAKAEAAEQEPVTEAVAEEEIDGSEHDPDFEFVGEYTVTFYCPCEKCCGKWASDTPTTASGTTPSAGRTVGTDWAMLPAGTIIYIDGLGEYTVEDKVANWIADKYDGYIIDVYCNEHQEALDLGKMRKDVWVLEW